MPLLLLSLISIPSAAAELALPASAPILTISGNIGVTNVDGTAQFDRAMLEALMDTTIETKTPWYDGVSQFEGVAIAKLLEAVGAQGETLTVVALNDYVTEIPISDFTEFGTILALKRNGEFMSVRDKGPLFIIYPYDDTPDLQSQTYFGRSAWQVSKMVVR